MISIGAGNPALYIPYISILGQDPLLRVTMSLEAFKMQTFMDTHISARYELSNVNKSEVKFWEPLP